MTYPDISTINNSDFSGIFVFANQVTNGLFGIMILLLMFVVVSFGTYFSSKRTSGEGDFIASFAVAGYFTTGLGFIMLLVDGLMTVVPVLVCLALTVVGTVWLYFDRRS